MSHSAEVEYEYHLAYPEWWDWWVKYLADLQARYFKVLIKHCTKDGKNPIYFVRYEDLCLQPAEELVGMMKFLLDLGDLKGTNMERRIDQLKGMGDKVAQTY